jgi:hypothetical protein
MDTGVAALAGVATVPLIVGATVAAKNTFLYLREAWAPWFALALGVVLHVGYVVLTADEINRQMFAQPILTGLAAGLAAVTATAAAPAVKATWNKVV